MNNNEPHYVGVEAVVKPRRNLLTVVISIFLILSILINAYLGYSVFKFSNSYKLLQADKSKIVSTLNTTENKLRVLTDENRDLKEAITKATELLVQYDKNYQLLKVQDATSRIPKGYYSNSAASNNSYEDLSNFLNYAFYLPKNYKLGVFDCSEAASYLEWVLQNNGYNAKIAVGPTPWAESGYHAWVLVETDKGVAAIEPTVLTGGVERLFDSLNSIINNSARGVIYYNHNDQTSKNYYESYTEVFDDITEAVKYSKTTEEWNWWEGSWGFE